MCNYLVDKEAQEFVKHTTKHYHKHCYEQFELGKQQRKELHEYICELYNMPVVSGFILKQIKDYEENYGYKLTGILLSLKYFHEIEGNSSETANKKYKTQGIGIVPYVYDKTRAYFTKFYEVGSFNSSVNYNNEEVLIETTAPKRKKAKLIDIENI